MHHRQLLARLASLDQDHDEMQASAGWPHLEYYGAGGQEPELPSGEPASGGNPAVL